MKQPHADQGNVDGSGKLPPSDLPPDASLASGATRRAASGRAIAPADRLAGTAPSGPHAGHGQALVPVARNTPGGGTHAQEEVRDELRRYAEALAHRSKREHDQQLRDIEALLLSKVTLDPEAQPNQEDVEIVRTWMFRGLMRASRNSDGRLSYWVAR